MSIMTKYRGAKVAIAAFFLSASAGVAMADGFSNPGALQGPTLGQMSRNAASSFFDVASGFEAFLYLLGVIFTVLFILAAWKYKKSDGRDGNMGLICTYLLLAVFSFAAPTLVGSTTVTVFGSGPRTSITAPSPSFN